MNYNVNLLSNPLEQFREAIQAAGIIPPNIIDPEGKLRRFSSNGKPGDDAGWYILHLDSAIPAGCFGDWRTGLKQDWRADIGRQLSPAEDTAHRAKINTMRIQREADDKLRKYEAQIKAVEIWNKSQVLADNDHIYLVHKNVKVSGIRIYNNALVIPLWDENRKLHSLQFIDGDGNKRFLTGGRVSGCYFTIGSIKNAPAVCITEGPATAATIHEATGYPVAIAFNAGNLLAVAKIMRNKYPDLSIILCADDDYRTEGNPGLTKAREAANAVGALLAIPTFGENREEWATDFNDMRQIKGVDAVYESIYQAQSVTPIAQALPDSQPKVMPFHPDMLPKAIRDYVFDVADRQQSPPDFVAVTAIVALSGLLGRKVLICPKQHDDWTVTPNQWGAIIGRPSAMKSPSMNEALKPLRQIEANAAKRHDEEKKRYMAEQILMELEKTGIKSQAKKWQAMEGGKLLFNYWKVPIYVTLLQYVSD